MNLTIGSGYTTKLLSGLQTKGFAELLQLFVANDNPYWNSFASPIDALRVGAILEYRYLETLSDEYYCQYKAVSKEMDCLVSSIDFAKLNKGKVVDFDELKTIFLTEYINKIVPLKSMSSEQQIEFIKKNFKSNYKQIQFQLYCTNLDSANLVFLSVESYDDDINHLREIKENDYSKFRISRDEELIDKIKERASIFQNLKNSLTGIL